MFLFNWTISSKETKFSKIGATTFLVEILAADFSHFYAAKNLIKPPLPTQLHNHSLQKQRKKSECACLIERESV